MTIKTYNVSFTIEIVGKNPVQCDELADYIEVDIERIIKDYYVKLGQNERFFEVYNIDVDGDWEATK